MKEEPESERGSRTSAFLRMLTRRISGGVQARRVFWNVRQAFGRLLLAAIVLPSGVVSHGTSGGPDVLSVLALPPHATVGPDDAFGQDGSRTFYFFSRNGTWRLSRLVIEHPMGARDLWRESWSSIEIPGPSTHFHVMAAAIGTGHLFLGGDEDGGGPVVRVFQIAPMDPAGGAEISLTGKVDYFPTSSGVAIRTLYLDSKARILWLGYDSGRVESGLPYLVLPDRLVWSDPTGYLPLPARTSLEKGPPPLLRPRALLPSGRRCFSCRFYMLSRTDPEGEEIVNHPLRSPQSVGSSMGLLPAGEKMGFFLGRRSFLCRVPREASKGLSRCFPVTDDVLPVAGTWWGNRLAYLFPPGTPWGNASSGPENGYDSPRGQWSIVSINPAFLQEQATKLPAGASFPLSDLLRRKGAITLLPWGSSPRRKTFFSENRSLVVFGKRHIYRVLSPP